MKQTVVGLRENELMLELCSGILSFNNAFRVHVRTYPTVDELKTLINKLQQDLEMLESN